MTQSIVPVLLPVKGCMVRRTPDSRPGAVRETRQTNGSSQLLVKWSDTDAPTWVPASGLRSGFSLGMEVQEVPFSRTRKTLGEGVVLENRHIGGRDQVLVEYPLAGQRIWVPFENLRMVRGVRQRFLLGQVGETGDAERFRLRNLAWALELWNQNTGSLSRLNIDPLPHQIHLVHHILASGNLNWLIADDVGLGKTIEVGMLLSALRHRGTFRRVLIVTPAGLVKLWQEEMHHKFAMGDFQIYGVDFEVNEPRHWKLHDHVIASMDRLKAESHLERLMQAGDWDLVIFDEAHRLSRRQWGGKLESSERFRLAAALRPHTDAMVLLSATPHQGMQDKFQALLELLRPELKAQIDTLSLNPEIIREMVIRNRKLYVTDANGEFIFRGKFTRAVSVPTGPEDKELDRALSRYFREGYAASDRLGRQGLAIGFVMTVYRKLAASSIAAIRLALQRRIAKLQGQKAQLESSTTDDARYEGEQEELLSLDTQKVEFFEGELRMLEKVKAAADVVFASDRKLTAFLDSVLPAVDAVSANAKLLIFTEYRATQDYLHDALAARYGSASIRLIHGGMTYDERGESIAAFEDTARFLISTEAGGEGLNLHRQCHILLNYDLPWNPMRLVQRIGRLYRYGQKKNVVVFNLHAPQTLDAQIVQTMYARISQVVQDMAPVGEEFRAGLEDEILGELAELLDVEDILRSAAEDGVVRTEERIQDAIARAREAMLKQRDLFEYATSFDPAEARGEIRLGSQHLRAFVDAMLPRAAIEKLEATHGGRIYELRLPEEVQKDLEMSRSRVRLTFDRDLAASRSDLEMADFESPLVRYLLTRAKSFEFGGLCAGVRTLDGRAGMSAILRWQNDQGQRMREEFVIAVVDLEGRVITNAETLSEWLMTPAEDGGDTAGRESAKVILDGIEGGLDKRLGVISNQYLHPEGRQLIAGAWGAVE